MDKKTLKRLYKEIKELEYKIFKLENFKKTKKYDELDYTNQKLLNIQWMSMSSYLNCLKTRYKINK